MKNIDKRLNHLDIALDKQGQYWRRNCLLLHRVQESNGKSTDDLIIYVLNKELNKEITYGNIDRSHCKHK